MIANQTIADITLDEELAPWKSHLAEFLETSEAREETPVWDDWGVVAALRVDSDQRDRILSELVRLTECSISGYLELLEFSGDSRLRCFAEVIVRQRAAECQQLRGLIEREKTDTAQFHEELNALQTAWRLAIWNLEQNRQVAFVEFAERAESLLEEAYLAAAQTFHDADFAQQMQDYAVTVCGARSVWEDFQTELVDGPLADNSMREDAAEISPPA